MPLTHYVTPSPKPMEKQPDTTGNLEIALANAQKGIVSIPIAPGKKGIPLVKWKRWQTEMPSEELFKEWFADTRVGIAIITTGMVVFDCDELAKAKLVLEVSGDTPHKLKTPRGGVHLGYRKRKNAQVRNQVRIKGLPIDIRTDGGLEMIPHSRTEHGEYRWIGDGLRPIAELPVARIGWTRERTKKVLSPVEIIDGDDVTIKRARGYLACVEGAISGRGGHRQTFRAACVLVQKFGLTVEQAFPLLKEWSEITCEPPWSDTELFHKLSDAWRLKK